METRAGFYQRLFTATLPGHCQERQRNQTVLNINLAGIIVRLDEVELMTRHWTKCCRAVEKFVGRHIELA